MDNSTADFLLKLKRFLRDGSKWTRGAWARRGTLREATHATDPHATCYCVTGAGYLLSMNDPESWGKARVLLDEAGRKLYDKPAVLVNDTLGHVAVMSMIDKAITLAQRRQS